MRNKLDTRRCCEIRYEKEKRLQAKALRPLLFFHIRMSRLLPLGKHDALLCVVLFEHDANLLL